MNAADSRNSHTITSRLAGIARDLAELAELQAKLFSADTQAVIRRSILPGAAIVLAICLVLGCVPVGLMAGAYALHEAFSFTLPAAMGIMAGGGLVVATLLAVIAWFRLRACLHIFDRSRIELSKNVQWLKHALHREADRSSQSTSQVHERSFS